MVRQLSYIVIILSPPFLKKLLDILPGSGRVGLLSFSPKKIPTLFRNLAATNVPIQRPGAAFYRLADYLIYINNNNISLVAAMPNKNKTKININ
jgi:hypothetical protein